MPSMSGKAIAHGTVRQISYAYNTITSLIHQLSIRHLIQLWNSKTKRSPMHIENKTGDNISPWLTPFDIVNKEEVQQLYFTITKAFICFNRTLAYQ